MLTVSTEIDNTAIINEQVYDWVLGIQSSQPVSPTSERRNKRRRADQADQFWTTADMGYWSSMQGRISQITPLADARFLVDPRAGAWLKFRGLVAQWHTERQPATSVLQMVMCPAYQRIISMGDRAIPLILSRLRSEGDEPDHWFWALRTLANVDPVPESVRGDIKGMAEAWLKWGEAEGYDW